LESNLSGESALGRDIGYYSTNFLAFDGGFRERFLALAQHLRDGDDSLWNFVPLFAPELNEQPVPFRDWEPNSVAIIWEEAITEYFRYLEEHGVLKHVNAFIEAHELLASNNRRRIMEFETQELVENELMDDLDPAFNQYVPLSVDIGEHRYEDVDPDRLLCFDEFVGTITRDPTHSLDEQLERDVNAYEH
jgi:hypothetical protein